MKVLFFDPRTKLALMLLCVFCAMAAPNLWFQMALVGLIAVFALLCGRGRYALRGGGGLWADLPVYRVVHGRAAGGLACGVHRVSGPCA